MKTSEEAWYQIFCIQICTVQDYWIKAILWDNFCHILDEVRCPNPDYSDTLIYSGPAPSGQEQELPHSFLLKDKFPKLCPWSLGGRLESNYSLSQFIATHPSAPSSPAPHLYPQALHQYMDLTLSAAL